MNDSPRLPKKILCIIFVLLLVICICVPIHRYADRPVSPLKILKCNERNILLYTWTRTNGSGSARADLSAEICERYSVEQDSVNVLFVGIEIKTRDRYYICYFSDDNGASYQCIGVDDDGESDNRASILWESVEASSGDY